MQRQVRCCVEDACLVQVQHVGAQGLQRGRRRGEGCVIEPLSDRVTGAPGAEDDDVDGFEGRKAWAASYNQSWEVQDVAPISMN